VTTPFSVTLCRNQTPLFPEQCAFSGLPNEGSTVDYLTRDGLSGRALWKGWYLARVPCCSHLKWRVHAGQAWRFCRTVVVGLGSLALAAWLLFPHLKDFWLGLAAFGCTVVALSVLVWWESRHPPRFDISVRGETVEFQFLDAEYAREFACLNCEPTADDQ
jgi:hypothetical protein